MSGPAVAVGVVRMWEVRVRPGRTADYLRLLRADVLPALAATDGLLAAEVFGPLEEDRQAGADDRIVLITRWRDREALEAAAGPRWRTAPIDQAAERALQARPAHVWHFEPLG